ncbi:hypothetical protein [Endozoicomonas sp. ALE010]|uniref:COG1470 family protein n=1 Tax=Endozoicomonas sp. ALE010 TaxID=3403081 RepID=UPI003BB60E05
MSRLVTPCFYARLCWQSIALCLLSLLIAGPVLAATPPGTLIRSQAQAYFLDEYQQSYMVNSNEVTTLIREVTGVRLENSQRLLGKPGDELVFPHRLINSGNITASYQLTVTHNALLYFDKNNDGQTTEEDRVTGPVLLPPGDSKGLLVKAWVPDSAETTITLSARVIKPECSGVNEHESQGRFQAVNYDTMSHSLGVVYEVTQRADKAEATINDTVTTTLSFARRDSHSDNSVVEMLYRLPAELDYVGGSTWLYSDDGTEKVHISDEGIRTPEGLRFRLEQSVNQAGVPVNRHDGKLVFETRVKSGTNQTLYNVAEYTFCEKGGDKPCPDNVKQNTNSVPLTIKGFGVALNGSPYSSEPYIGEPQIVVSATAGGIAEFTNYLWNRGTTNSQYKVTLESSNFPEGAQYCLTTADSGCSPFIDQPELLVNDIESGSYREIRLLVKLPENSPGQQADFSLQLKATDILASYKVEDTTENILQQIEGSADYSVDLTCENCQNGNGAGQGPEDSAVVTLTGNAGETLRFEHIVVNNTGNRADSYLLDLLPKEGVTLPNGIRWSFVNEFNQTVTGTGVLVAGQQQKLSLLVELPDNLLPGTWSFYVKAASPVNRGVADQLHLAMIVEEQQQITLTHNGRSQVSPGSFVTFIHQLSNPGNQTVSGITLHLEDSRGGEGWQSLVYHDTNSDGRIDGDDPLIQGEFSLPAKETRQLIVKVFAPASASPGSENITTLTARFGGQQSMAVTNSSMANNAIVVITKIQAEWDCSSSLPTHFSNETFPVKPGECVVYKLTATNQGSEPVHNVVIYDKATDFTRLHNLHGLPEMSDGGEHGVSGQTINATWSQGLMPGQSVCLKFGIQIQ